MIQYLIILLDETSVSFCHYNNEHKERNLIPIETLKAGILYGMKENLNIQFVYPDYEIPEEYNKLIETIDHIKIKPYNQQDNADVVVINGMKEAIEVKPEHGKTYVLRSDKLGIFSGNDIIIRILENADRLNIALTDVETFTDNDFKMYEKMLSNLSSYIEKIYVDGRSPQLNILTDRMMLNKMNNCGAGDTTITLAPDGKFYVCPAFYQQTYGYSIGSLTDGIDIKNSQLYKLAYAPICRKCDAYQCRRCVWLNRKTTLEVNTPSHEQCVLAHIERNESRKILYNVRKFGTFLPEIEIKEIKYLDPFDQIINN